MDFPAGENNKRTEIAGFSPHIRRATFCDCVACVDIGRTPRQYQLGEADRSGRISKCGDRLARTLLYEAAVVILARMSLPRGSSRKSTWPLRAGLACAECERADRRVVGVQHRLCPHGRADQLGDRRQPPCRPADPVGQGDTVDLHAFAGKDGIFSRTSVVSSPSRASRLRSPQPHTISGSCTTVSRGR